VAEQLNLFNEKKKDPHVVKCRMYGCRHLNDRSTCMKRSELIHRDDFDYEKCPFYSRGVNALEDDASGGYYPMGIPWKCHVCKKEGKLDRKMIEDLKTMASARCPSCFYPVVLAKKVKE